MLSFVFVHFRSICDWLAHMTIYIEGHSDQFPSMERNSVKIEKCVIPSLGLLAGSFFFLSAEVVCFKLQGFTVETICWCHCQHSLLFFFSHALCSVN